ncbi:MAG: PKD domain-containing protein [Salibacteraceae bacterium]
MTKYLSKGLHSLPAIVFAALALWLSSCQKTPEACFEPTFSSSIVGKTIGFRNCTQDGVSYRWDFGDGGTSEQPTPIHDYARKGTYTVTLRAFSENGNKSDEVSQTILIGEKYLTRIEVVNVSLTNENGGFWDPDTSGPDLAFYFGPDSLPPNVFASADTVADVDSASFPVAWDFSSQNIQLADSFWFFQLHDINTVGISDLMGSWKVIPKPKVDNPFVLTNPLNAATEVRVYYEIRP